MFFRNLTLFRFPTALDLSELEARLAEFPLKPVGPLEMSSRGFVSPIARDTAKMKAATSPDTAAGTTTFVLTAILRAPMP